MRAAAFLPASRHENRTRRSHPLTLLRVALVLGAGVLLLAGSSSADEIELTSGKRYQGRVVERTSTHVTFKIMLRGASAVRKFRTSEVKSLNIDGKVPTFEKPRADDKPKPRPRTKPPTGAEIKARSDAEITALIRQAGQTPPDWWDSVPLEYPDTLDLAGTRKVNGWQPQVKVGAHFYSIISPNKSRWKKGIRLFHHLLTVRRGDPRGLVEAMNLLARSYCGLLRDCPRGAFWWHKVLSTTLRPPVRSVVGLAECYWRLGNKRMAVALLRRYGLDRAGYVQGIKLWAKMGDTRRALQLAGVLARARPGPGYLVAGDVHRSVGDYRKAIAAYERAIQGSDRKANRLRERARAYIETIRVQELLDVSKIPDGAYTGTTASFRGPLTVEVKVKEGKIESVRVTRHRDDLFYTSLTDIPEQIVQKQSIGGVDAVSGATVTSDAIVNAAARALAAAMK